MPIIDSTDQIAGLLFRETLGAGLLLGEALQERITTTVP
jgi:hypothetical protein